MTDKATPEAMRLAAWLNEGAWHQMRLVDVEAAGRELRRQHARIAELEAEIAAVGAGGVQALSAAPADQSELHAEALRLSEILIAMGQGSSPDPEELWADGYEPSDGDVYVHRAALVLAMLAASPTPPAEQQAVAEEIWRPMETAPKDGTVVRLFVEFEDGALNDEEGPQVTIGSNTSDNTKECEPWQFAGWNWSHDCYMQGTGTPIGWLPLMQAAPKAAPAPLKLVGTIKSGGKDGNFWRTYQVDWRSDALVEGTRLFAEIPALAAQGGK